MDLVRLVLQRARPVAETRLRDAPAIDPDHNLKESKQVSRLVTLSLFSFFVYFFLIGSSSLVDEIISLAHARSAHRRTHGLGPKSPTASSGESACDSFTFFVSRLFFIF